MDTVEENEVLSEPSENGPTSNDSFSLTEDEDNSDDDMALEDEEDFSDADSCIEVSDDDEGISDFKSAFKEVRTVIIWIAFNFD